MRPVPTVSQLVRVAEWRWVEPGSAQGRHFGTSPFSASASASACATSPAPAPLKLAPMPRRSASDDSLPRGLHRPVAGHADF